MGTSLLARLRQKLFLWALLILATWGTYYFVWGRYLYLVTAYCNCPICINVKKYHDGRFANGKPVRWGGIAADPSVPFGTRIELVPHAPQDMAAEFFLLRGRNRFTVEDRGGKIKGRHIDLFIPKSLGGHKTALKWGIRRMRIKINGELAK